MMTLSPHPYSLRQLQYAVAVAEARSFRRAALLCHVSQPSLSAQVAQLESGLGVRLFERTRRRVMTTDAGEEILRRARQLLLEAGDLVDAARERGDPLSSTVRIGIIPTVAPYLVPRVARVLRERFPRLTVAWVEDKTAALAVALGGGTLDAAIMAQPVPATAGRVEHAVIGRDEFVLAVPPDHPFAVGTARIKADALRQTPLLLLEEGHCLREQALAVCAKAGVQELGFRATSLATLVQMVSSGAGVTLLPTLALPIEQSRADLGVRAFAQPAPHRTLVLVWRSRSFLGEALRQVAEAMQAVYPEATPARRPRRPAKSARRAQPPAKRLGPSRHSRGS